MSFLFTDFCPDIERTIIQNVGYRNNMNNVINTIKEAGNEVFDTYTNTYELTEQEMDSGYYSEEMFELFIDYLDIPFNFMTNEEYTSEAYQNP